MIIAMVFSIYLKKIIAMPFFKKKFPSTILPVLGILVYIFFQLNFSSDCFAQKQAASPKTKITMGVVNAVDSAKYVKVYTPFIRYIARKMDIPEYELKVLSYGEIAGQIAHNEIDIAIFSPLSYIRAKEEFPQLKLFAIPKTHQSLGYHSVVVVIKSSGIKSLNDLKGKKFAFTHIMSTSGFELPKNMFYSHDIDPQNDMEVVLSGGHKKSIEMLLNDEVEGIATYLEVFEELKKEVHVNPEELEFIYTSGLIPNNAYVLAPGLDAAYAQKVKDVMYRAHESLDNESWTMFNNDLKIQQWMPFDDAVYNDLRALLGRSRLKHTCSITIEPSENVRELFPKSESDLLTDLHNDVRDVLLLSNRFASGSNGEKQMSNGNDKVLIKLTNSDDQIHCSLYLNNQLCAKTTYEKDELHTDLPPDVLNRILGLMPIKTRIVFDPKSKHWFITYGAADGIDVENYSFELTNKSHPDIILETGDFAENAVKDGLIIFPEEFDHQYSNETEVLIKYKGSVSNEAIYGGQASSRSFWDSLDNIWGVVGLLVALLTVLFTAFFQYQKHKRFKKMLFQANGLLKDYFEGEEITAKIVDLKVSFGTCLENHYIKEIQYNVLTNKLREIQTIIEANSKINEELRQEIESIIADGIITEKEYQHLIHRIKQKKLSN